MRLPKKTKQWIREIEKVDDKVYEQLENHDKINKAQFEAILILVAESVAKNRRIEKTKILEKSGEVVEALLEYLKGIPEEKRNWTEIIAFLYMKFHQIFGLINEQQVQKILTSQLPCA